MPTRLPLHFAILLILASALNGYLAPKTNTATTNEVRTWRIIPVGAPFYTPDTGWALAAFGLVYFGIDSENDEIKPSAMQVGGLFTERLQVRVLSYGDYYFLENDVLLKADLNFEYYPSSFFGLAYPTSSENEEGYIPRIIEVLASPMYRIRGELYAGPSFSIKHHELLDVADTSEILTLPHDGLTSGIGARLVFDSRDDIFYARRGFTLDVNALYYTPILASAHEFGELVIDYRHFWGITGDHVIAMQTLIELRAGLVPFQHYSKIGGQFLSRGYEEGRDIGKNMYGVQVEYRFPIVWRFGGVVFLAASQVANEFDDIALARTRFSGGLGLRLQLTRSRIINFRFDLGFNAEGDMKRYFQAREAF